MTMRFLRFLVFAHVLLAVPARADVLRDPPLVVREGNANNAKVGVSVSTAGDVNGDGYSDVLLGSQTPNGTVYCYHGGATPTFVSPAWTQSGAILNEWLGARPAPAGDLNADGYDDVVIGAPLYSNGQQAEGAVFVYLGSGSGLNATPQIIIEGNVAITVGNGLGGSVDTAGDVNGDGYDDIVAGSSFYSNGQSGEGRICVFYGSASGAPATPSWSYESDLASAGVGSRVAGIGDINADGYDDIAASAPFLTNGQTQEGRLYVFLGSAGGPALTPSWTYETNVAFDEVGYGLGMGGDVNGDGYSDLVCDIGQQNVANSGALVFFGSASGLSSTYQRKYSLNHNAFADIVYAAGDVNGDGCADLIANEASAAGNNGQFYILGGAENSGASIPLIATRIGSGAEGMSWGAGAAGDVNGDGFGDVIIGSPFYDNGQTDEGIVRVYLGQGSMPHAAQTFQHAATQAVELCGAVLAQGDWNGDGYTDLAIGRPNWDFFYENQGIVSVYYGGEAGYSLSAYWSTGTSAGSTRFGAAVGNAGDIDNDGDDELVVGEPSWATDTGRMHIYKGSPSGLPTDPSQTFVGEAANATYGAAVDGAGDTNGDGFADVIVGSPTFDVGSNHGGKIYLYRGSASGLQGTPHWTNVSAVLNDQFGAEVCGIGDMNGDGYSEFAVGCPRQDAGHTDEGVVYVYYGFSSGVLASWSVQGNQTSSQFGRAISSAGDVNGDGLSDLIFGVSLYDSGGIDNRGAAFLYTGTGSTAPISGGFVLGPVANYLLGISVAGGGDVNNDGRSDILVGAPYDDSAITDGGKVSLYLGVSGGVNWTPAWTHTENEESSHFGYACTMAGDATGDGFADVVVGQPWWGPTSEGRVNFFLGGRESFPTTEIGGVLKRPRQFRSDGVTPLALGGRSDFSDAFRLGGMARSARGRTDVQLQYQISQAGIPLPVAVQTGPAFNTGAPIAGVGSAAAASHFVSGLTPDQTYHWRVRFATDSPYFPYTSWYSIPWNGAGATDVRMAAATTEVVDGAAGGSSIRFARVGPNPCRDEASLSFVLPTAGMTSLTIHDVSGRRIATVLDGELSAGSHVATWDVTDGERRRVPAGVYFANLEQAGTRTVTKLIVRK